MPKFSPQNDDSSSLILFDTQIKFNHDQNNLLIISLLKTVFKNGFKRAWTWQCVKSNMHFIELAIQNLTSVTEDLFDLFIVFPLLLGYFFPWHITDGYQMVHISQIIHSYMEISKSNNSKTYDFELIIQDFWVKLYLSIENLGLSMVTLKTVDKHLKILDFDHYWTLGLPFFSLL